MHSKRATRGRAAGGPRGGLRVEAPGAGRARGGPETLYWRAELLEEIFGVSPLLNDAANATDLADLFVTLP